MNTADLEKLRLVACEQRASDVIIPAGAPHFSASKDDGTVVQETGDGATGTTLTEKK